MYLNILIYKSFYISVTARAADRIANATTCDRSARVNVGGTGVVKFTAQLATLGAPAGSTPWSRPAQATPAN
jgi:hypothetical protein